MTEKRAILLTYGSRNARFSVRIIIERTFVTFVRNVLLIFQ